MHGNSEQGDSSRVYPRPVAEPAVTTLTPNDLRSQEAGLSTHFSFEAIREEQCNFMQGHQMAAVQAALAATSKYDLLSILDMLRTLKWQLQRYL